MLDATAIVPRLWQGARAPAGPLVADHGFDALVLCAIQHQLPASSFPGVQVLWCPLYDDGQPLDERDTGRVLATAEHVAELFQGGRTILVTCFSGVNRSGLVSALSIRAITECTGKQARRMVQSRVPGALSNEEFCRFLDSLKAPRNDRPQGGRR